MSLCWQLNYTRSTYYLSMFYVLYNHIFTSNIRLYPSFVDQLLQTLFLNRCLAYISTKIVKDLSTISELWILDLPRLLSLSCGVIPYCYSYNIICSHLGTYRAELNSSKKVSRNLSMILFMSFLIVILDKARTCDFVT